MEITFQPGDTPSCTTAGAVISLDEDDLSIRYPIIAPGTVTSQNARPLPFQRGDFTLAGKWGKSDLRPWVTRSLAR
ncbi:MAG: hypothetical protein H7834_16295 [Magnetococcus sp. YQC-9]